MLKLRVSDQELTTIRSTAARFGISPQRLLVESAVAGNTPPYPERRAQFEELMALRRLLAALGNNVNQLARVANATSQAPPLEATVAALARAVARTDALLSSLERRT